MNSKKKKLKNTIVLVLALGHAVAFAQLPACKNPSLPVEAGETSTLIFSVTADKLAAIGPDMKRRVPPGVYEIMVGKNSVEVLSDTLNGE